MPAPPALPIPPLQRFLDARRLSWRQAAAQIGVSHETLRRACLPFGDPRRKTPGERTVVLIYEWTEGAIRAVDHYPPELSQAVAA